MVTWVSPTLASKPKKKKLNEERSKTLFFLFFTFDLFSKKNRIWKMHLAKMTFTRPKNANQTFQIGFLTALYAYKTVKGILSRNVKLNLKQVETHQL